MGRVGPRPQSWQAGGAPTSTGFSKNLLPSCCDSWSNARAGTGTVYLFPDAHSGWAGGASASTGFSKNALPSCCDSWSNARLVMIE